MPIPLKTTRGWNRRRKFVKAVARGRAMAEHEHVVACSSFHGCDFVRSVCAVSVLDFVRSGCGTRAFASVFVCGCVCLRFGLPMSFGASGMLLEIVAAHAIITTR